MKGKWLWGILAFLWMESCLLGCNTQEATPVFTATQSTAANLHAASGLAFPYTMSDHSLVAEGLLSYEGQYWEDGSGDEVRGVAALMLFNPTNRFIPFGAFAVEQGGKQLYFFVYQLPPMSRCLILEKNRQAYSSQPVSQVKTLSVRWDYQEMSREQIDYLGFGPQLTLINRDTRQQKHVIVYYKRYEKKEDYYLGGVAYTAHFFSMETQEHRTVSPPHYDAGHAKIVAIKLES